MELKTKIKADLPKQVGIIFDGWTCDSEHYIANVATWTNSNGGVPKRLLSCGVQDLADGNVIPSAANFGFSADDLGDLASYDHNLGSLEFLSGDNCFVNQSLAEKITAWLSANMGANYVVP